MIEGELWIDGALGLFLLIMAVRCFLAPTLHEATVSFIAFGLAAALAWSRLAAPDVALAEAAIGASLFGVLLLDSIRVFRNRSGNFPSGYLERVSRKSFFRGLYWVLLPITGLTALAILVGAVWHLEIGGGLTGLASESLPSSGVEHGVTAVLLNYRGFDTWLELAVLFLAWIAILASGGDRTFIENRSTQSPDALTARLLQVLLPLLILVAGYLLWAGKAQPGGAFQAGVVLAAALILARLGGYSVFRRLPERILIGALLLGLLGFFLHGIQSILAGRVFLEFEPSRSGEVIFLLELAASISIGLTLALFFIHLHQSGEPEAGHRFTGKGSSHG